MSAMPLAIFSNALIASSSRWFTPGCRVYFQPAPEDAASVPAGQPLSIV
jgi:hypothetical protein